MRVLKCRINIVILFSVLLISCKVRTISGNYYTKNNGIEHPFNATLLIDSTGSKFLLKWNQSATRGYIRRNHNELFFWSSYDSNKIKQAKVLLQKNMSHSSTIIRVYSRDSIPYNNGAFIIKTPNGNKMVFLDSTGSIIYNGIINEISSVDTFKFKTINVMIGPDYNELFLYLLPNYAPYLQFSKTQFNIKRRGKVLECPTDKAMKFYKR